MKVSSWMAIAIGMSVQIVSVKGVVGLLLIILGIIGLQRAGRSPDQER